MDKDIYNSIFQKEIRDLIELKRALGFSYESETGFLRCIDAFLYENNLSEKRITKELCDLWCRKRTYETVTNQASRISIMRVSELRLARIRDINLEEGYISVHEAKNHKERLIPIHPSLIVKCKELKEKIHFDSSEDEYFFMMKHGQPMSLVNVYRNFRRYLENAGISHTGRGPRVHDFRYPNQNKISTFF